MNVLTFVDHYLPAHKAGGPVRSVSNMVASLPADFECRIVTRDRDLGDERAFLGIDVGKWSDVGRARVLYLAPEAVTLRGLSRIAADARPDVVYLNGLFSRMSLRYLLARRLGLTPRAPVVLAPRGELSPGALRIKSPKKRLFLLTARRSGLFRGVIWHASAAMEKQEIEAALGRGTRIEVARNIVASGSLREPGPGGADGARPAKRVGSARFVFVSRISPKKNLEFALRLLGRLSGDVSFEVYGPIEAPEYRERCERVIGALPRNVKVTWRGVLEPERIHEAFFGSHFFVFPTLGENFGHVIYESLMAGCPVVLSDTTPWADLERAGAGWVIPLDDEAGWASALQRCVDMGAQEHLGMTQRTADVARSFADPQRAIRLTAEMFERAVASGDGPGLAGLS